MSLISLSSMFFTLTPFFMSLFGTWSMHLQYFYSNLQYISSFFHAVFHLPDKSDVNEKDGMRNTLLREIRDIVFQSYSFTASLKRMLVMIKKQNNLGLSSCTMP